MSTQALPYDDPQALRALVETYKAYGATARHLQSLGYGVSGSTIRNRCIEFGIPIQDPGYRRRSEKLKRAPETPADIGAAADEGPDTLVELLEWFESRTVPDAPPPTAAANPADYATCLVGSDLHFPHQHDGALEVFLGLADIIKPTEIAVPGDAFDFAQIGRYVRNPNREHKLQDDIDQCRALLARIEVASPHSVRRFMVGNHEEGRWNNYLFTRAPELASLRCLTMEAVLGLTEMGWAWQPYEYWPTDSLCVYHGDRHTSALGGGSAMSARKESIDMGVSTVTGHTHHAGAFFRQDRAGYRVSYEIGCLCDWRKMQAAGVTTRRTPTKTEDWHNACALIRYRPGHSAFRVELIPIVDDGRRTFAIWQDSEIVA